MVHLLHRLYGVGAPGAGDGVEQLVWISMAGVSGGNCSTLAATMYPHHHHCQHQQQPQQYGNTTVLTVLVPVE